MPNDLPAPLSAALLDPGAPVSLAAFAEAVAGARPVAVGPATRARLAAGAARLAGTIAEERLVYGITTGFGPLANRLVPAAEVEALQRNLVYHLASGVGALLPAEEARALVLARLISLARGWSGAGPVLADLLAGVLAAGLAPVVPERGTVGASGDLTPAAHMALALMGEGAFTDRAGRLLPGRTAFAAHGLRPWTPAGRDGLALVNGTSAMTGIAALNAVRMDRLLLWAERLTGLMAEVTGGRTEAWDPAFGQARPHPGQVASLAALSAAVEGSARVDRSRAAETRFAPGSGLRTVPSAHQDPYTTRCAPQLLGAARDAAAFHAGVVERELNAATDNPIFPEGGPPALHGGNFYGGHVALASDALRPAAITLAVLAERQLARLVDPARNGGLPPFLAGGAAGLHSGFMGAQVTASALLAELRAKAGSVAIQSIPTNGDNQDVVSLGTIAARTVRDAQADVAAVLAILALALAQAVDLLGGTGFSPAGRALWQEVRTIAPPLGADRPLSAEIAAMAARIRAEGPPPA